MSDTPMQQDDGRLAPCPTTWCKREDAPHTWQDCADEWCVICPSCGVNGPTENAEAEAIEAWDSLTRAADTIQSLQSDLDRQADAIGVLREDREMLVEALEAVLGNVLLWDGNPAETIASARSAIRRARGEDA